MAAMGKLLALLTIVGIGIWVGSRASPAAVVSTSSWHWTQLASAMVAVIWAYDGVSSIAAIAGEVRDPQRTLPISLTASIGIIAAVYVLVNLIYFIVLGFDGVAISGAVAAAALKAGIGPAGGVLIAVMVMASALGTVAAQMVGNPRFFVGPAENGLFPARLAAISPRTLTPVNAILMTAGIAMVLVTLGSYGVLIRLYVLSYYPFVVVALLASVRLRQRQGKPKGFAMPWYPLPLLLYGISVLGICAASAVDDPMGAIWPADSDFWPTRLCVPPASLVTGIRRANRAGAAIGECRVARSIGHFRSQQLVCSPVENTVLLAAAEIEALECVDGLAQRELRVVRPQHNMIDPDIANRPYKL